MAEPINTDALLNAQEAGQEGDLEYRDKTLYDEMGIDDTTAKIYAACRNLVKITQGRVWYPFQRRMALRIIKSIVRDEGEEIVVEVTRQAGKSQGLADLVFALSILLPALGIIPDFKVAIFAPKDQQSKIIFNHVKTNFSNRQSDNQELLKAFNIQFEVSNGKEFKLSNGALIKCETASENASIEGITAHLIIIDECQDVSEMKILKSIYPMGASTNATKVLIGTPNFEIPYLFKAVQKSLGKDTCLIIPYNVLLREKYYLFRQTGNKFHLNYKKFIRKEMRNMGEDSDAFRTQFKLEWITERTRAITIQKLEELAEVPVFDEEGNEIGSQMYSPIVASDVRVFAGVDIAKMIDATVVTVMSHVNPVTGNTDEDKAYIYDWLYLQGDNYEDQYEYIRAFLDNYSNIDTITLDATGVGEPMADWFRKNYSHKLSGRIIGLKLTRQLNSDLYTLALGEMNNNRVFYPMKTDKQTLRQFLKEWIGLEKEYKGNILVCHNDENDKFAHDDFCDSLAMALYSMYQPGSTRYVQVGEVNALLGPMFNGKGSNNNKGASGGQEGTTPRPLRPMAERGAFDDYDKTDDMQESWFDSPPGFNEYDPKSRRRWPGR